MVPPSNRLEVRINDQWRVVFRWKAGNAHGVRIIDHH